MDTNNQETNAANREEVLLAWQAPTHSEVQRSKRWYAIGGTIVLAGSAYGILVGAWSLAIVMLLCAGLYMLLRDHTPKIRRVEVTRRGITFDGHMTTWSECVNFWMIATPAATTLFIAKAAKRKAPIVVQIGTIDPSDIRSILSEFIKENPDKQEGFLDMITRICKL